MLPVFYHTLSNTTVSDKKQNDHLCQGYREVFLTCMHKKINSQNYDSLVQSYNLCGDMETKYFQCIKNTL